MAKPFVTIELDKPRKLRFDLHGLKALQDKTGLALTEIGQYMIDSEKDIEKLATILWAGFIHEDKNLTVEKVMSLVTWDKLPLLFGPALDAFADDMGFNKADEIEKNESRVKNQKSKKNGHGTSPSSSPAK